MPKETASIEMAVCQQCFASGRYCLRCKGTGVDPSITAETVASYPRNSKRKEEEFIGNDDGSKGIRSEDLFPNQDKLTKLPKEPKITIKGLDGTPITYETSPGSLSIQEGGHFYFEAWIGKKDRILHFTINNEHKGNKSNNIFPEKLVKLVLSKWSDEIDGVAATWYPDEGTNITQYQQAIADGKSEKEAVLETWTGKLYKKLGYPKVVNISEERGAVFVEFGKDN